MSLQTIVIPRLIQWRRHCKNGLVPEDKFYQDTTAALNHSVAYRRKPIFEKTCKLGQVGGASGAVWRWYCRTGYGAQRFSILCVLGLDDRVLAVQPYVEVAITKVGGSTTTVAFHGGASSVASVDAPEQWLPQHKTIDCDANAYYSGEVTFYDNVRVIALLVYEDSIDTVTNGNPYMSTWSPTAGSPIYSSNIGNQTAAVGAMHRKNGALRLDWNKADGTAQTRSSATPANLIDNSTTGTPTAATLGYTLVTTARNTVSATTVPITMAVYGHVNGTGHVYLRDTAGNDAADVSVIGTTPGWFTAAGALTVGSGQKYDLMLAGTGVHAINVYAVSIFEEGT